MGRTSDARERLLKVSGEVIPVRGYTAVGVHELCELAGVKPGSFYYLFASKQQLVLDMLVKNWEQTTQNLLTPISNAEINGLEKISQFFLRTYQIQASISEKHQTVLGCIFGNLGGEMANQDETIRQKVIEIFSGYISYLETWLTEAIEQGLSSIKPEQVHATAEAIFTYYEGVSLMARTSNSVDFFQKLSDMALVLAGATE